MVVVVPVGPGTKPEYVLDTVMSYMHYTRASFKIVIMDDSHQGIGEQVRDHYPWVEVISTPRSMGVMAGLYINLSLVFRQLLERYRFHLLFKLDTDALITGPEPEQPALQKFQNDTRIGIAGQYPNDYHGRPWDTGWPRDRVLNGVASWKFIKRPRANLILRRLYRQAVKHGYKAGESVFGGAYFLSERLLMRLDECGLLPDFRLRSLNMGEDHLFALLARSQGFTLESLSEGDLPFACAWKGLPDSPDKLWLRGKKIIHSTRGWTMNEDAIRSFFREKRLSLSNEITNG